MNRKVMKIDLSAFFDDERKMVYIMVDHNWESVACLQKRVELLFGVESVRFLYDGCFLPPQEPIEILTFCDCIKAFVSKESLEKRKKKKLKKCKNVERTAENPEKEEIIIPEAMKKKRKSSCLQTSNSSGNVPRNPKRSKNVHSNDEQQLPLDLEENISKVKSNYEVFEGDKLHKPKSQIGCRSFDEKSGAPFNLDYQHEKHCTSTPKENAFPNIVHNEFDKTVNDETKTPGRFSSIPQRGHTQHLSKRSNSNNPFTKPKSGSLHIYFKETGEVLNSTPKTKSNSIPKEDKQPNAPVIFRCPLIDVTNGIESQKPRIFNFKSKEGTGKTTKEIVEIQENIILPPLANRGSATNDVDDYKQINESPKDSSNEKNSLNNATIATDSTVIAQNSKEDEICGKNSEVSQNQKLNISETVNESQTDITDIRDVTDTKSQIELRNIDVNTTENVNKSQTYIDENCTVTQNVSKREMTNDHPNVNSGNTQDEQHNYSGISNNTSIDYVDLSNDLDEVSKLEESAHEKCDLNADDTNNSSIEEISEIIDLNETQDNCNGNISSNVSEPFKDIKIKNILPLSIDVTSLPKPEDVIIFKVPYKKNNEAVDTTDFIAGKVQYINKRTKNMKVMIIDGLSEMRYVPPRFFYRNIDNSQDFVTYLQISLADMREPKLYLSS